jgi:hypothetical protein
VNSFGDLKFPNGSGIKRVLKSKCIILKMSIQINLFLQEGFMKNPMTEWQTSKGKQYLKGMFVITAIMHLSCNNGMDGIKENPFSKFEENPVSITWHGEKGQDIQSFQAQVNTFAMNNRSDTQAVLSSRYQLALKTIDGKIYSRIDFEAGEFTSARSVVSDGTEMVFLDPVTGAVVEKMTVEVPESPLFKYFTQEPGLSRINLSFIREEAQRLALDMYGAEEGKKLVIDLPGNIFPQNQGETVTRRRISFDTTNDTLAETAISMVLESGTVMETTITPVYEEKNGIPVKIGMVTVIESKAPELIGGFDDDAQIYDSIDDLPELSAADLERLLEAGNVSEDPGMKFGDPCDLGYTETVIEMYENVDINNVSNSLFRPLL